LQIKPKIV